MRVGVEKYWQNLGLDASPGVHDLPPSDT